MPSVKSMISARGETDDGRDLNGFIHQRAGGEPSVDAVSIPTASCTGDAAALGTADHLARYRRRFHPWHRLYCGQQTVEIIVRSHMRVDDDNKRNVFARCSIGLVDRAEMSAVGQKANTPRDEMVPLYLQSRTSMLSAGPFRAIKRYRG
jgi:hypothetical protein